MLHLTKTIHITFKGEITLRRKTIFIIFILVITLVGCSNAKGGNLLNKQGAKESKQTVEAENGVRPEIKAKIDSLTDYAIIDIKHMTKGIEESGMYEPESPKEFKAGEYKILFQNGNDSKTIVCQTEEIVGHLQKVIPGKTVVGGFILYHDGEVNNITEKEDGLKLNKAEGKYFIEQIYKRFSHKMTKKQAVYLNSVKDFALAIYFNGNKGIDEFHAQQIENLIHRS